MLADEHRRVVEWFIQDADEVLDDNLNIARKRPTLPEMDEYEHSQNSARRSMTPPCQNRGPSARFNGAAAFRRWKGPATVWRGVASSRFNGATGQRQLDQPPCCQVVVGAIRSRAAWGIMATVTSLRRDKNVETIPAKSSSGPVDEVLNWQSRWQPA